MQGVKENDKTQYDVIALCPDQYKSGLFALYAFNNEVNAAVAKASDPKFALMRLQWWKDTCMSLQNIGRHNSVPENAGGGGGGGGSGGVDVRANLEQQPSVIQALAVLAMHRPGRIDFDWLSRVVEAKQTLLAGEGMTVEGMEDLLTRADNSYGALLHLSMAYMNVNDQVHVHQKRKFYCFHMRDHDVASCPLQFIHFLFLFFL